MAFGFTGNPIKYSLTVYLTRIMFPYVFFICLVALCMGILNAMDHFAAPSLAPVLLNISMIAAIYIVSFYTTSKAERIIGLSVGVLVGGILQLAFQIPFLIKKGFYFWQKARFFHPELKKIWILMIPAVFGSGVYQINAVVIRLLASMLPEGSVSYLYYSDRLVQFPLGIFAISMGTAVLPSLSRQVASGDTDAVKETFSYALKLVFFIMVPAMVGLIALREPIVRLLFERGEFDPHATRMTATALMYFAMGIWAIGAVRILVPTFYAMQDSKTPVLMAVFYAAANIVLGLILMRPLGHCGLALAMSISSVCHFFLLLWALRKKMGPLGIWNIIKSICKTVVCSSIMGICIWKISLNVISHESSSFLTLLSGITGSIAAGILIYWLLSFIAKSQELEYLMVTIGRSGIKSE
jgi:putative peptidoglycan lipid II flippase